MEHTFSMVFRLLQDTHREPFALWQLTDNDFQPKMGVVLDRESREGKGGGMGSGLTFSMCKDSRAHQ